MSEVYLPEEVLNKLNCQSCTNILSVSPIYAKKDGTGAVCGRCKPKEEGEYFRDERYESVFQFLNFPCVYKQNGCTKKLESSLLKDHERACDYKNYGCPTSVYTKCIWEGSKMNLFDHFKETHVNLLIYNQTVEIDFANSVEEKLIMKINDDLFVVKKEIDADKESFLCTVEHLKSKDSEKVFNYFLRVRSMNSKYFKCNEKATNGEDSTKLLSQDLNEKVSMRVEILVRDITKSNRVLPDSDELDVTKFNIDWKLLSELECPVCYEYMVPRIFLCEDGHSICATCKPKVEKSCPICRKNVKNTYNFTLEKLTEHIIYPCRYYKFGCSLTCKHSEKQTHEERCDFRRFDCPLKDKKHCVWTGVISEVTGHVESTHNDSILKNNRIGISFVYYENFSETYLIIISKKVFKLSYNNSDSSMQWSMSIVGTMDDNYRFTFHIDIFHNVLNKKIASISGPVLSYNATIGPTNSIYLSKETFLTHDQKKFTYFVKVTEERLFELVHPQSTTSYGFGTRIFR